MKIQLIHYIALFWITIQQVEAFVIVKNLKTDFGAIGDGKTNDSRAWAEAIKFFSGKKDTKLFIPKGTYLIGEQSIDSDTTNKVRFANLKYPALLKNTSNLVIEGETDSKTGKPVSIIKYLDGLYYGYLNPVTKKEALIANMDSEANLGAILNLDFTCKDIVIRNLELDGNFNQQIYFPLPNGVKRGFDIGHYGITSYSTANLLLENLYAHHFALDGFYIQNDRKVLEEGKYHTIVKKCRSDLNGRQGLSFTVGSSILLVDSEFTNTGRGRVRISPAANVDIENHDASGASLKNIRIENCTISNNLGGAGSINIAGKVEDIIITNSVIDVGNRKKGEHQGYSITSNFSPNKDLIVRSSTVRGKMLLYGKDKRPDDDDEKTSFENCKIIDNDESVIIPDGQFLIDSYDGFRFQNCQFYLNKTRKILRIRDTKGGVLARSQSAIFQNCKVYHQNSRKKFSNLKTLIGESAVVR